MNACAELTLHAEKLTKVLYSCSNAWVLSLRACMTMWQPSTCPLHTAENPVVLFNIMKNKRTGDCQNSQNITWKYYAQPLHKIYSQCWGKCLFCDTKIIHYGSSYYTAISFMYPNSVVTSHCNTVIPEINAIAFCCELCYSFWGYINFLMPIYFTFKETRPIVITLSHTQSFKL